MKYISVLVFAIVLGWTWHVIHSSSSISFETHSGIQEKLAELITSTIKAKRPTATDVMIEKLWTEVISDDKVEAHFVYSFKDQSEGGITTTEIQGSGLLERQAAKDDQDRWSLTKVHTSNDAVVFDDAVIITADGKETPENSQTPANSENKTETQPQPEEHK
jgi:hypothetical protein